MATATYRSTITADAHLEWTGASYTPDDGGAAGSDSIETFQTFWDLDGGTYKVHEAFIGFDLTSPTTGDAPAVGSTISAVTLNMYLADHGSIARTLDIYAYDWGASVGAGDWRTVAQLQTLYDSGDGLVASYNIPSGWGGAEGNHDFTSGASAESAVSAAIGSTLRLIAVIAALRAGTTPTSRGYCSWGAANNLTESRRPLLTVEYSEPAGFSGLIVTRRLQG
jgi:hypothetical protein